MKVDVDVEVNRSINTTDSGTFLAGRVLFRSTVTAHLPTGIKVSASRKKVEELIDTVPRVNLSRQGGNPNCNMRLDSLELHDHHAPTFSSQKDMEDYIERVMKHVGVIVEIIDNKAALLTLNKKWEGE